jgi:uncharacterized membrane protein YphA (DoxX/SURF4 family)
MTSSTPPSALGRTLYSGVLAYMAYDGFKHNEKRVEAAAESGVPFPEYVVPFVTGMLFVANLGILLWKYPRASAGALVVFFVGTTPVIHNYWTMEGAERQGNRINFLKNLALLGCSVMLLAEAASDGD